MKWFLPWFFPYYIFDAISQRNDQNNQETTRCFPHFTCPGQQLMENETAEMREVAG